MFYLLKEEEKSAFLKESCSFFVINDITEL